MRELSNRFIDKSESNQRTLVLQNDLLFFLIEPYRTVSTLPNPEPKTYVQCLNELCFHSNIGSRKFTENSNRR